MVKPWTSIAVDDKDMKGDKPERTQIRVLSHEMTLEEATAWFSRFEDFIEQNYGILSGREGTDEVKRLKPTV